LGLEIINIAYLMSKLSLSSLDKTHLEGKKVLVRVDFNVPLNEDGQ